MGRRTSIEVDDEKLCQVQKVLGTKGLKDTIDAAFDAIIKTELRRELAEQFRTGDGLDLGPEMFRQVRPRTPW